jgi:hypothetical protein
MVPGGSASYLVVPYIDYSVQGQFLFQLFGIRMNLISIAQYRDDPYFNCSI